MTKALADFDTRTKESIKKLIKDSNNDQQIALNKITKILGNPNLDNNVILQEEISDSEKKKEWITAIYEYQNKKGLSKDGIVDQEGRTYTKLKEDLTNK
jgi:murein L,D-transpeptidase YcbB/YkuD